MKAGSGKTALKIIYFLVLFALGILIALTLPNLMLYRYTVSGVETMLAEGTYSAAVLPLSGYFNNQPVVKESLGEGKGFVVFEGAFVGYIVDEAAGTQTPELRKSYAAYLYGVREDYHTAATENNLTMVRVTNGEGATEDYPILDYDLDGNGTPDSNSAISENGLVCIQMDQETFRSLRKVTFIDCDGKTFATFSVELDYEGTFFDDVGPFIEAYRPGMTDEQFVSEDAAFRSKSEHYLMCSVDEHRNKAIAVSCVLIGVYFLLIYVVYDLTLGKRALLRLGRRFLEKVFRVDFSKYDEKKRAREQGADASAFGRDYYCKVTVSLDLEEVPDFRETVSVRYTGGEYDDVEFLLTPDADYTETKRVHAGLYKNPWIEMDRSYAAEGLPENLDVEGFTMDLKIKIHPTNNERAGNQT